MNDLISTEKELEKVVLVAIRTPDVSDREVEEYLDELAFLAETAGAIPVKRFVQSLPMPDKRYFVGSGSWKRLWSM